MRRIVGGFGLDWKDASREDRWQGFRGVARDDDGLG